MKKSRHYARAATHLIILWVVALMFNGCTSITGTQQKVVDSNGLAALADAKGMVGFIRGDYLSFPDTLSYFRYSRQETSGWFNSASRDVRETVICAWPATNSIMPKIVQTINACRAGNTSTNSVVR